MSRANHTRLRPDEVQVVWGVVPVGARLAALSEDGEESGAHFETNSERIAAATPEHTPARNVDAYPIG